MMNIKYMIDKIYDPQYLTEQFSGVTPTTLLFRINKGRIFEFTVIYTGNVMARISQNPCEASRSSGSSFLDHFHSCLWTLSPDNCCLSLWSERSETAKLVLPCPVCVCPHTTDSALTDAAWNELPHIFTKKRKIVNSLSAQNATHRKQQQWSLAPCSDFARWTKFKTVLDARVHKTLANYIIFCCGIVKLFFFFNALDLDKSHTFLDEDKKCFRK